MSIKTTSGEILRMPGGEVHVKPHQGISPLIGEVLPPYNYEVALINGGLPEDMVALQIWADSVHRDGKSKPALIIPYLPGARQDRRQKGEALSAKVYADMINKCNLARVVCVDPHSDVMPALINNCVIVPLVEIFKLSKCAIHNNFVGVIAPDAGAAKRANIIAEHLGVPVYQALKKRDSTTGKLTKFTCQKLPKKGKLLVVDDICDGGGTFMGLAEATGLSKDRLVLWVTHGIFSGKAVQLLKHYSRIYTTNSHLQDINWTYEWQFAKIVDVTDITPLLMAEYL